MVKIKFLNECLQQFFILQIEWPSQLSIFKCFLELYKDFQLSNNKADKDAVTKLPVLIFFDLSKWHQESLFLPKSEVCDNVIVLWSECFGLDITP